ncbi:MAG: oxidoreductase [Actinomycetaceae bacterium]|nr:oxidoreductase [Actinomycetaceae bacterium]
MKTWFITGVSRGFGREWASAALERGDRVAGTARDLSTIEDLADRFGDSFLPIRLDVTDRTGDYAAVDQASRHFGRLDVVVNNAGYGQFGMVEELSEADIRRQMETNFFGAVWVTQAALPIMRAQGGGHIVQVSSIAGVTAVPNLSAYHASKWALEGFSQSLAQETARFGIHVTLVEPGAFATDWGGASAQRAHMSTVYDAVREDAAAAFRKNTQGSAPGDPAASAAAVLAVVDAECPPLRIFLGEYPLAMVTADYNQRLEVWHQWQHVSAAASGH